MVHGVQCSTTFFRKLRLLRQANIHLNMYSVFSQYIANRSRYNDFVTFS